MKHRNPLAVVALSIVTIGIYDLYWLYDTKKELNAKTQQHVPSILWLILSPLVIIIGYIILFSSTTATVTPATTNYNGATVVTSGSSTASGALNTRGVIGIGVTFIGGLIVFTVSLVWFYKYSKAVNQYTSGKMSTAVSFLLLWIVHLIGIGLIQDVYNDMGGPVPVKSETSDANLQPQPVVSAPPVEQLAAQPVVSAPPTPAQVEAQPATQAVQEQPPVESQVIPPPFESSEPPANATVKVPVTQVEAQPVSPPPAAEPLVEPPTKPPSETAPPSNPAAAS